MLSKTQPSFRVIRGRRNINTNNSFARASGLSDTSSGARRILSTVNDTGIGVLPALSTHGFVAARRTAIQPFFCSSRESGPSA